MSKRCRINKLGMELALSAILSAMVGMFLFMGLNSLGYGMLDRMLFREDVILAKEQGCIDSLQEYVTKNSLSSGDSNMLDQWAKTQKNLLITLYKNDNIFYSNDGKIAAAIPYMEYGTSSEEEKAGEDEKRTDMDAMGIPWAYRLQFADGTVEAVISYFFEAGYYTAVSAVNGIISVSAFMILLFLLIRRKVRYIALLEREIHILKGGDLDYSITVKGKDELASLAAEMDAMRLAVRERQEQEESARDANRDLVTAMSHDLRTPLTSLLGYVDILQMERWKDEEQYRRCLASVRDKAYQIKDMSDKMFEYFIVYGKEKEELETIEVNGAEFLGQVVEESLFDMENQGFAIERSSDDIDCRLMVDIGLVRRVFGNIFSNLLKYADPSHPVTVEYRQGKDRLWIRFTNHAAKDLAQKESSSIGLKTCAKIMGRHRGSFVCSREGCLFVTELEFPTLQFPAE